MGLLAFVNLFDALLKSRRQFLPLRKVLTQNLYNALLSNLRDGLVSIFTSVPFCPLTNSREKMTLIVFTLIGIFSLEDAPNHICRHHQAKSIKSPNSFT